MTSDQSPCSMKVVLVESFAPLSEGLAWFCSVLNMDVSLRLGALVVDDDDIYLSMLRMGATLSLKVVRGIRSVMIHLWALPL